jgi:hypothetical protein
VVERGPSVLEPHDRHDPVRIAGLLDRVGTPPDGWRLLRQCPECRLLHADLAAILGHLPHTPTPPRHRDHTLTASQAARLHRGSPWAVLWDVGSARDRVTRPLGLGFTTLGLAGLLLTTVPMGEPAGAVTSVVPEMQPAMMATPGAPDVAGPPSRGVMAAPKAVSPEVPGPAAPTPLHVLSGVLLALGGASFVLGRRAPREGVR